MCLVGLLVLGRGGLHVPIRICVSCLGMDPALWSLMGEGLIMGTPPPPKACDGTGGDTRVTAGQGAQHQGGGGEGVYGGLPLL